MSNVSDGIVDLGKLELTIHRLVFSVHKLNQCSAGGDGGRVQKRKKVSNNGKE